MKFFKYNLCVHYPDIDFSDKVLINTINPHSFCVALKDNEFKNSLIHSTYLLPDGIGIVLASRFIYKKKIKKIAGYDIFENLMSKLNEFNGKAFFLGASEETLMQIKNRSKIDFPNVQVNTLSPPYKDKFTNEDSSFLISEVNLIKPHVLFIGMTAPKQEKWAYQFNDKLNTNVICSIGAVFDFYAGTIKRPKKIWINLGLEWFIRFIKEPKRLFKRNFVSTPIFLWFVLKEKIKSFHN
jgi:N-acetylglucosaminyldiphosphoundecaprenol N-acetyl-beta-D-mannosaminyltransferase